MRGVPLIVTLELQTKLVVVHSQIAVASARHRLWRYLRNLLGNNANIGRIAAVIAEAVQAEPIVEITDQNDVMLKPDIRTTSAAATATAAATTAASAAAARRSATAAAAAPAQTAASAATASGDVRVVPAASAGACCAMRSSRFCALP